MPPVTLLSSPMIAFCTVFDSVSSTTKSNGFNCTSSRFPERRNPAIKNMYTKIGRRIFSRIGKPTTNISFHISCIEFVPPQETTALIPLIKSGRRTLRLARVVLCRTNRSTVQMYSHDFATSIYSAVGQARYIVYSESIRPLPQAVGTVHFGQDRFQEFARRLREQLAADAPGGFLCCFKDYVEESDARSPVGYFSRASQRSPHHNTGVARHRVGAGRFYVCE